MKTELRIPSRLFLAAGKDVESALQEATYEALREHGWRNLIATWEDGKVVIIPGDKAANKIPGRSIGLSSQGNRIEELKSRRDKMFLNLICEYALQIYIEDQKLYIEFSNRQPEVGCLLEDPDNLDVLRSISRKITGREMALFFRFVDAHSTRVDTLSVEDMGMWNLVDILYAMGDRPLAQRIEALKNKMETNRTDSLRMPGTFPIEGDDLSSHKGE